MSIQALPVPKSSLSSPNFLRCTHLATFRPATQFKKVLFDLKLKSGFWDSAKRVNVSVSSLGRGGGLIGVRCGMSQVVEHDDGYYIRRCVELAKKAIGHTSPNPMVGCLIAKDGKIVGEGFHPKAGQPHAEVFALRDAGELAENGTAYVSLEPCNHYGRTPPCTEALIKAKVKKVVVGMVDPNPMVASKGVARLQDAGIEVSVGVEEELCRKLNEAFIHKMLTGKPFVTLRYTMSVDGHLIDHITDGAMERGGYYSRLLEEFDAVVVSSAQSASFPSFASKEPGANQPLQIVLSKCPSFLSQVTSVPSEGRSKIIIFADKEAIQQEVTLQGIETVILESISLSSILDHCTRQGFCNVLLDLRGNLDDFKEILREGSEHHLFQKFVVEVLPVFGGTGEKTLSSIPKELRVKKLTYKDSGDDSVLLEGYF